MPKLIELLELVEDSHAEDWAVIPGQTPTGRLIQDTTAGSYDGTAVYVNDISISIGWGAGEESPGISEVTPSPPWAAAFPDDRDHWAYLTTVDLLWNGTVVDRSTVIETEDRFVPCPGALGDPHADAEAIASVTPWQLALADVLNRLTGKELVGDRLARAGLVVADGS